MEDRETTRRTGDCRIKLAPDMLARLEELAKSYGFPVATMAAVAVAEWVNGKEQQAKNQRMMLLDVGRQVGGQLGELFQAMADSPDALAQADTVASSLAEQIRGSKPAPTASGV